MNIVDHVLVKEMISTASENTESTERESSLPPPSRQKPFYVFFSLIPIRFASFSTHSSPPHPVFILAHLLCSNPFFLSLTRCRGSANWSRLCHDTGTWHNCWTNSVPFSIRPVSAKQHADSNWLETLITGPAPQHLIGRGFPQEWGCLCAVWRRSWQRTVFAAEADANTRQKIRTVPYGKLIHKYDISVSLRVSIFFFFLFSVVIYWTVTNHILIMHYFI